MASSSSDNPKEIRIAVQYRDVPPQIFISKLNKFVRENQPPGLFSATMTWDRVITAEEQELEDLQSSAPRELPSGYSKIEDAPLLKGVNHCVHCLCSPCVVMKPPVFLRGACDPHPANAEKRYVLYRKFWRCLNAIGVWQNEEYLTRKELRTSRADKRDIMPDCIIEEIRRYPSHDGYYRNYVSSFDATMDD